MTIGYRIVINLFKKIVILAVFGALSFSAIAKDNSLTIAVASNFAEPLETLINSDDRWNKLDYRLVVGSTGMLHAQIMRQAPFDLFFAADEKRPVSLHQQGFAEAPVIYASGKLVLWSKTQLNHHLDVFELIESTVRDGHKLAIANPKTAPFGLAAYQFLANGTDATKLKKSLVYGNNVSQTFQFVDSGNARMGIVALSLLLQAEKKFNAEIYRKYVEVPQDMHEPINQFATVIKRSANTQLAQKLLDFVRSESSQRHLMKLGYVGITTH